MLFLANVLSLGLAVLNTCNRKYCLINFYTFCFQSDQKCKFGGVCTDPLPPIMLKYGMWE